MTQPIDGMRILCNFYIANEVSLCNKWIGQCSYLDTTIYQDFGQKKKKKRKSYFFLFWIGENAEPSLGMRIGSVRIQAICLLFWVHQNCFSVAFHNSSFGPGVPASCSKVLRTSGRKFSTSASALAPSSPEGPNLGCTLRRLYFSPHAMHIACRLWLWPGKNFFLCLCGPEAFSFSLRVLSVFAHSFCVFMFCFDNGRGLRAHFPE